MSILAVPGKPLHNYFKEEKVLKSTPHLASPHERGGISYLPSLHRGGLGEGWIDYCQVQAIHTPLRLCLAFPHKHPLGDGEALCKGLPGREKSGVRGLIMFPPMSGVTHEIWS